MKRSREKKRKQDSKASKFSKIRWRKRRPRKERHTNSIFEKKRVSIRLCGHSLKTKESNLSRMNRKRKRPWKIGDRHSI